MRIWDDKYCKGCVHYQYEEVEPEVNKWICMQFDSPAFDHESEDAHACEFREIRRTGKS